MNELYHFNFKNSNKNPSPKKNFLYVAKVPLKNKTWRYFYDKAEYEAYLKGRQTKPLVGNPKIGGKNDNRLDRKTLIGDKQPGGPATNFLNRHVEKRENKAEIIKSNASTYANKLAQAGKDILNRSNINKKQTQDKAMVALNKLKNTAEKAGNKFAKSNLGVNLNALHDKAEASRKKFNELLGGKTLNDYQRSDYTNHAKVINPKHDKVNNLLDQTDYGTARSTYLYKMYQQNCQSCATAFDMRMKGYDVKAAPQTSINGIPPIIEPSHSVNVNYNNGIGTFTYSVDIYKENPGYLNDIYKDCPDIYYIKNQTLGYSAFEQSVKEQGADTWGMCFFNWKNGGSHVANYYVDNNSNVILIDSQTGKVGSVKEYYDRSFGISWLRTDNLNYNHDSAYLLAVPSNTSYDNLPSYLDDTTLYKSNNDKTVDINGVKYLTAKQNNPTHRKDWWK